MGNGNKVPIIAVSLVLLVAIVGSVTYGIIHKNGGGSSNAEGDVDLSTSSKAIKVVCQPTDYKETCEKTLASANTTEPKDLIKIAFQATITDVSDSMKKFLPLKEATKDERTSEAMEICEQVFTTVIEDTKTSIDRVGELNLAKIDIDISDLRTWTGGAATFHETCLDAFENTSGDTGEKMKELLKTAGELIVNGLDMVTSITEFLNTAQVPENNQRRLLHLQDSEVDDGTPSYVDDTRRKLLAAGAPPKPNAVVAQDGSGQFKSINDALKTVPVKNKQPFVILVKAGVYKEIVLVSKTMTNVVLVGEGPTKTKITGNKNFIDGTPTFFTATVAVEAVNFTARDIGFENSAGPDKHQAVALRVTGDYAVLFNCQMDAYQDTLYAHNKRQFYRDCTISGTVDFVFGDAQAVFQNCKFVVRKPMENQACMVTAQGRKEQKGPGALILQASQILPAPDLGNTTAYLGRPWKTYSRTIIMNSFIDGFISPLGWAPWAGDFAIDTCYYAEYQNQGPGADTSKRVTWKGIKKITPQIAESFAPAKYYLGNDAWIVAAAVPYDAGMKRL